MKFDLYFMRSYDEGLRALRSQTLYYKVQLVYKVLSYLTMLVYSGICDFTPLL